MHALLLKKILKLQTNHSSPFTEFLHNSAPSSETTTTNNLVYVTFKADSRPFHTEVFVSLRIWGLVMTITWQQHKTSFIWAVLRQDGM